MYRTTTRKIEVAVKPRFVPERSSVDDRCFLWAYTVAITNRGQEPVQLQTRSWRIIDALGRTKEVRGAGVVGEQPVLQPGETFEYTSEVPLPTSSGVMTGAYGMLASTGEAFDIAIPMFSLDSPDTLRTVH